MKAAEKASNDKVTVLNKDGTVNEKLTRSNVASVQNFVGSLGADSKVWSQIQSIDRVSSTGDGRSDIGFTVQNRREFLTAVLELGGSDGYKRFAYFGEEQGHKDSTRGRGYGVTDPSMHL